MGDHEYGARWKEIERECRGIPIQTMIGDHKLTLSYQVHLNPIISFTLSSWFGIIKQLKLWPQVKLLRWIAYDTEFKPNCMDPRFKSWANKGITAYRNIMDENTLQDFQLLKVKYNLGNDDFYRSLQTRRYFLKEIRKNETIIEPSGIIQ